MSKTDALPVQDHEVTTETFLEDVYDGFDRDPRWLPSKYLYDEVGSKLFDLICQLDEYYPTRTETKILDQFGTQIAQCIGANALLAELGSGSSTKTRLVLDRLETPAGYVPIDISKEHLIQSAKALQDAYPDTEVLPVCADYMAEFVLPKPSRQPSHAVVLFPGSTIGNLEPDEAVSLLERMARVTGTAGGLLLGVDLQKSPEILQRAYDDSEGVTAAFSLNYLVRMNRELGANFDIGLWTHQAHYNEEIGRIEIGLVSEDDQFVHVGDRTFKFAAGELVRTEHAYKYTLGSFAALAARAGWKVQQVWQDEQRRFSVQYLEVD